MRLGFRLIGVRIAACIGLGLVGVAPDADGFTTAVIDAGHGGHDRGGIPRQRVAEKEMTLDVARRLESYLRDAGVRTVMTRRTDTFVPLATRAAIASRQRDALLVSVHFNSAAREGAAGTETYFYSSRSYPYARAIQDALVRSVAIENRGVKRRGFYVLRKSAVPAVLVECGFLTNGSEARRILQPRHRDRLAREIAEALLDCRAPGRFRKDSLQAAR
jgi:N-acetylmuramoyl-L-alanine amidase